MMKIDNSGEWQLGWKKKKIKNIGCIMHSFKFIAICQNAQNYKSEMKSDGYPYSLYK